jgi:hypothetical protein
LPPGSKFDLKASTDRGEAHNDYGEPVKVDDSERGAVIAGSAGGGPQLRLETGRGTITVRKASADEMNPEPPTPPNPPAAPKAPHAPIEQ